MAQYLDVDLNFVYRLKVVTADDHEQEQGQVPADQLETVMNSVTREAPVKRFECEPVPAFTVRPVQVYNFAFYAEPVRQRSASPGAAA